MNDDTELLPVLRQLETELHQPACPKLQRLPMDSRGGLDAACPKPGGKPLNSLYEGKPAGYLNKPEIHSGEHGRPAALKRQTACPDKLDDIQPLVRRKNAVLNRGQNLEKNENRLQHQRFQGRLAHERFHLNDMAGQIGSKPGQNQERDKAASKRPDAQ